MGRELKDLFSDARHELTGVQLVARPPIERYTTTDEVATEIVVHYGKTCERLVAERWSGNGGELPNKIISAAGKIREILLPEITDHVYQKVDDIATVYQRIAQPINWGPPISPALKPLNDLFTYFDGNYETGFLKRYRILGEYQPDLGVMNPRVRLLVESALAIERILRERSPFQNHHFSPNCWVNNFCQFDGVLIPKEVAINGKVNLATLSQQGEPFTPLEIKLESRTRFTTGKSNRLDRKGPFPRHIQEMQKRFANAIIGTNGQFQLPESMLFLYLRGTLPNVFHHLKLNHQFLSSWRLALLFSYESDRISLDQRDLLLSAIDKRQAVISKYVEEQRENVQTKLPEGKLKQGVMFNLQQESAENDIKDFDETSKRIQQELSWPIKSVTSSLLSKQDLTPADEVTSISFQGASLYTLARFHEHLAVEYSGEIWDIYTKSRSLYGWLTDLYSFEIQKTPDSFLSTTGYPPFHYDDEGHYVSDYVEVNAKQFILEFGVQLILHLRTKYSGQKQSGSKIVYEVYGDELRLLRHLAELLKYRSFRIFLGKPNDNNTRDILRIGLTKRKI